MTQQPAAGQFPPPSAPPGPAWPSMPAPAVPPPGPSGRWRPERVDAVPGTEFGLVQLQVVPITSGLAVGSLIAGIGSIVVAFIALCFGVRGASSGWGGVVAGAFTLLSVIFGGGAIALGLVSRRQIRRSGHTGHVRFVGRGLSIAGLSCGCAGAGIALLSLTLTLVLQVSS